MHTITETNRILTTKNRNVTPLFMGAESCEKSESLQTYFATFLMSALYGSKKLRENFGNFSLSTIIARSGAKVCKLFALQIWQRKVARRK